MYIIYNVQNREIKRSRLLRQAIEICDFHASAYPKEAPCRIDELKTIYSSLNLDDPVKDKIV